MTFVLPFPSKESPSTTQLITTLLEMEILTVKLMSSSSMAKMAQKLSMILSVKMIAHWLTLTMMLYCLTASFPMLLNLPPDANLVVEPRVKNDRIKILWNDDGVLEYQKLIAISLASIR